MTSLTKNHKTTEMGRTMILATAALVLFTAMLMMATLEYPYRAANATSLTNANHITTIHNTHCDGVVCQTLGCINNDCRTNTSQVLNSNVPCYLPCLPAQPPKSQ
ncbi:MAG: hypothetical protein WAZ77_12110 [Candidatus Nitrosopolaris sp.]